MPSLEYTVDVAKMGNGLDAKISVDGTQNVRRYTAKAVPEGNTLRLLFASYGEGDIHYEEKLAPDALLGTIQRSGDGSLQLKPSALPAVVEGQSVPLASAKPRAAVAQPNAAAAATPATSAHAKSRVVHYKCPKPGALSVVRAGCMCADGVIHDGLTACGPKSFSNVTVEPGGCAFECAD